MPGPAPMKRRSTPRNLVSHPSVLLVNYSCTDLNAINERESGARGNATIMVAENRDCNFCTKCRSSKSGGYPMVTCYIIYLCYIFSAGTGFEPVTLRL